VTFGHCGCCTTSGCAYSRELRRGSSDLWSHPVLLLRKKRGKKPGMRRTYFRSGPLPDRASSSHVTVTSGQKPLLRRIWGNFRLRMCRIYFRTGSLPVTSLPVTWLPVAPRHRSPSNNNLSVPIYYKRHFQQYFSYIRATSLSGGKSRSTRREPPTMGKQLVNLSLAAASRVHPFCNSQSRVLTYAVLVIGLNDWVVR
jgi:hypothetical protein